MTAVSLTMGVFCFKSAKNPGWILSILGQKQASVSRNRQGNLVFKQPLEQLDIITALLHAVLSLRTTTLQPPYSNIAAIDGGISSSLGMGENYLQLPLSLKSVAAQLNMNPNYLSTLYKKETGSTITDFINQARMRMALQLLNTDTMQVQAIAAFVGIDDVNYFSKLFKKTIGITPTAYRNIVQGKTQKSEILEKTSSFMSKMQNDGNLHSL